MIQSTQPGSAARHAAVVSLIAAWLSCGSGPLRPAAAQSGGSDASSAAVVKTAAKADPKAKVPAKVLFGAVKAPAALIARSIGFYARGCLAGARPLPVDGPAWQAMRLSRNRNWGHPVLIDLLERFAKEAQAKDGWPGLLVGDISQPRGGPMLTGHASHQVGLDADIWLTPMPDHRLSADEREKMSAVSMLASDKVSVDPKIWNEVRARLIRRAASYPEVERIFVHPAIKKALCEVAPRLGGDKDWLDKVRPYWGHHYHFHVRIHCPRNSPNCRAQDPVPGGDGCGKELDDWLKRISAPPRPPPTKPAKPAKPKPPITLASLPDECRAVLESGKAPAADSVPVPTRAPNAAPAGKAGSLTIEDLLAREQ